MKKLLTLLFVTCLFVLVGCGGGKTDENANKQDSIPVQQEEEQTLGVGDTVSMDGHQYIINLLCEASDTLPQVKDEQDEMCKDNTIQITIRKDGAAFFNKVITKQTFRASMDNKFYERSILDCGRFVKAEPGKGLKFTFSVGYPYSDMSVSFWGRVSADGAFSYEKVNDIDV